MANAGEQVANGSKNFGQNSGISGVAEKVRSEINTTAQEWGSALKETGADITRRVEDVGSRAYDAARQKTLEGADKLQSNIRDYPWVAVGAAFGLGALFASMCRK